MSLREIVRLVFQCASWIARSRRPDVRVQLLQRGLDGGRADGEEADPSEQVRVDLGDARVERASAARAVLRHVPSSRR
jgi:hypothetical protein